MLCLSALGSVLSDMGVAVHVGDAESAAHGAYAQMHATDALKKKRVAGIPPGAAATGVPQRASA
jgi:hypothetical protein